MNYKVLYRKYRPKKFDDVIGQDYVVKSLKNTIIKKNYSHSYIFSGPRGTGKTSIAKIFAKTINCKDSKDGNPCEKCFSCINFKENPDIIEIDAASNNGVDQVRELIDNVKFSPTNSDYKIYIIDEVHMMSVSAFNALLLTLEEPPSHAIFIFATTNIESVPITILSRCQRYDFQKIDNSSIKKKLIEICDLEDIRYEEDALDEITYLSDGGLRDALSLLDQVSKLKEIITLKLLKEELKILGSKDIENILDSIEQNNFTLFKKIIEEYKSIGINYIYFLKKMINFTSMRATLRCSKYRINYKELTLKLIDSLNKTNINIDNFIILEMILLDYFELDKIDNKTTNLVKEKNEVKSIEKLNNSLNFLEYEEYIEKLKKTRVNNCFLKASKTNLEKTKKIFNSLVNNFSIEGKIRTFLTEADVVLSSPDLIVLTIKNIHLVSDANKNLKNIEELLKTTLNITQKLIFLSSDEWENLKIKYMDDLKKNIHYTFLEEPKLNEKINDIFGKCDIEIV